MSPKESSRRISSTREPRFYEAGQDVTGIDDPLASYGRFVDRVVTEYKNLAVVFQFVQVDAGQAVYRQHTRVRDLYMKSSKRPWSTYSKEAVKEWLSKSSPANS